MRWGLGMNCARVRLKRSFVKLHRPPAHRHGQLAEPLPVCSLHRAGKERAPKEIWRRIRNELGMGCKRAEFGRAGPIRTQVKIDYDND